MEKIVIKPENSVDFGNLFLDYPKEDGWCLTFIRHRGDVFYILLEREVGDCSEYVLFAKGSGFRIERTIRGLHMIPVDFFKLPGEQFLTIIFMDPGSMATYITNDKLLGDWDMVHLGGMVTSTDITSDGRFVAGYYGGTDDSEATDDEMEELPTLTVSTMDESRNDYLTDSWYGRVCPCLYVHVDEKDQIWMNLPEEEETLCVCRKVNTSVLSFKTEDRDFDAFGISSDEKKLLVCHTRGEMPTEFFLMEYDDGWYHNEKKVEIEDAGGIDDVTFYRNRALCKSGDKAYFIDIDKIASDC